VQGVIFALGEFGIGYSSLTYLRRLSVNLIKIDQSLCNMLNDADDLSILRGGIALAKSIKCDVIAEGVDKIEHGTALIKFDCESTQGYGIARPMPASEVLERGCHWKPSVSWQTQIKKSKTARVLQIIILIHNDYITELMVITR